MDEREVFNLDEMNFLELIKNPKYLFCLFILFSFSRFEIFAQYGYVKVEKDSVIKGFIKPFREVINADEGLEIWKTKKDRSPSKILKRHIQEYAIGKDTIKVVHDYTPFSDEDFYFDNVDARYVRRGKLNLLIIKNFKQFKAVPIHTPSAMLLLIIPKKIGEISYIYILEDKKSRQFRAMPFNQKDLREALLDFFSERFLQLYEQKIEGIKYKSLPKLIEFYNSKD